MLSYQVKGASVKVKTTWLQTAQYNRPTCSFALRVTFDQALGPGVRRFAVLILICETF